MYKIDSMVLITGMDIEIPNYKVKIHQPTIKEIAILGEDKFFSSLSLFILNLNDVRKNLSTNMVLQDYDVTEISDYEILFLLLNSNEDLKKQTLDLLKLILVDYKIEFNEYGILLKKDNEFLVIEEELFYIIKDIIHQMFSLEKFFKDKAKPVSESAAIIAEKMRKAKEKINRLEGNSNEQHLFSNIISILGVSNGNDIMKLSNFTVYQLYNQFERFTLYFQYDQNIKIGLAGGQVEVIDWFKQI